MKNNNKPRVQTITQPPSTDEQLDSYPQWHINTTTYTHGLNNIIVAGKYGLATGKLSIKIWSDCCHERYLPAQPRTMIE